MQNYDPVTEMQKGVLASLLKWGYEGLNGSEYSVTENDFISETFREIFVKLKKANFNTPIMFSEYAEQNKTETLRFVYSLEKTAIHCSSFPEYVARLRELTSKTRLRIRLSECLTCEGVSVELLQSIVDDEIKKIPASSSETNTDKYIHSLTNKPKWLGCAE
jgi:hypothetical protein